MNTPSLQYTRGGESELDVVTRRVKTRLKFKSKCKQDNIHNYFYRAQSNQ